MILTIEQVENEVSKVAGTWVKRRNLRKRLTEQSNKEVNREIDEIKKQIRCLKSQGLYQADFRSMYSEITQLELRLIWNN